MLLCMGGGVSFVHIVNSVGGWIIRKKSGVGIKGLAGG